MDKVVSRPMGRPRKRAAGDQRRLALRCSEHDYALVVELASERGISLNEALLEAVYKLRGVKRGKRSSV